MLQGKAKTKILKHDNKHIEKPINMKKYKDFFIIIKLKRKTYEKAREKKRNEF